MFSAAESTESLDPKHLALWRRVVRFLPRSSAAPNATSFVLSQLAVGPTR